MPARICATIALLALLTLPAGCFDAGAEDFDDAGDASAATSADACLSGDATRQCGGCETSCAVPDGAEHMVGRCVSGSCQTRCASGWVDADGDPTNGCEWECTISNGGSEICDGKDNDCNGVIDDGFKTGSCTVGEGACQATGAWSCETDQMATCDATPKMPGEETCGDGVDNDCDGEVDEDDAADAETWYRDGDGDGYGDPMSTREACERPDGFVGNDEDCDDGDEQVKPRPFYPDEDGDGFTTAKQVTKCAGTSPPSGFVAMKSAKIDCDDTDEKVNPAVSEVCDGNDTDCDGQTDNIPQSSSLGTVWYVDCDGDGFAAGTSGKVRACDKPPASRLSGNCQSSGKDWTKKTPNSQAKQDCHDEHADVFPGQSKWFTSPIQNPPGSLDKWDYNCSEWQETRWTGNTNCDDSSRTVDYGGWVGTANVDCGNRAEYWDTNQPSNCGGVNQPPCVTTCKPSAKFRTQKCH